MIHSLPYCTTGYWKDSGTPKDQATLPFTQTAGTQKRRAPTVLESDDADSDVPVPKPTKKAARKAPQPRVIAAAEKLFLDEDEDESVADVESQGTTRKSRPGKTDSAGIGLQARGSKRRHIIVDDDSDDGVAFKGFCKKTRLRQRSQG